jgi:hypothetical protein
MNAWPRRLGLRELRWGRAVAGPHAAWWFELSGRRETLSAFWQDGRLSRSGTRPKLADERQVGDERVARLAGLGSGPARWLLRLLAGDPRQTRWHARTSLEGVPGWAVHEVVRWR